MKELPPNPPIWTPPPPLWYKRHRHDPAGGMAAVTKTMCAMWLTMLDCLGLPAPEKARTFAPSERELFARLEKRDAGAVMDRWLELCSALKPCEYPDCDPAKVFNTLLVEGGRHG